MNKGNSRHAWRRRSPYRRPNRRGPRPVYGALDLGTHNCRLLVARARPGALSIIASYARVVRLGEGLAASGRLSEPAMERTLLALGTCATKLGDHGVTRARLIATEACRRADNCADFLLRVKAETGLTLEAISFEEEARLALAGCQGLIENGAHHALVFDIGGGSTEVVWAGREGNAKGADGNGTGSGRFSVLDVLSLPMGVVTLSERSGARGGDPAFYAEMVAEVAARLPEFCARNRIRQQIAVGGVQMLGTSGTVTTLGAVYLDLPFYSRRRIDGLTIAFDSLEETTRRVVRSDHAGRVAMPCVGEERADLMVSGCAILQAIRERWPVGRLRIADRGLREGILLDLMTADGFDVVSRPPPPEVAAGAP